MARIGSVAAAPFVGGEFVSLYLGATRVPTVPGKPEWDGTPPASGGQFFQEVFVNDPENDGGSDITSLRIYVNEILSSEEPSSGVTELEVEVDAPGTYEIAVAAVNAVGEGPRLKTVYEYVE
jgi:hypothetical protein